MKGIARPSATSTRELLTSHLSMRSDSHKSKQNETCNKGRRFNECFGELRALSTGPGACCEALVVFAGSKAAGLLTPEAVGASRLNVATQGPHLFSLSPALGECIEAQVSRPPGRCGTRVMVRLMGTAERGWTLTKVRRNALPLHVRCCLWDATYVSRSGRWRKIHV